MSDAKNKTFGKTFRGVSGKNIYPTTFEPGDDVPFDLEAAADAEGVIETDAKKAADLRKARQAELSAADADADADADAAKLDALKASPKKAK